MRGGRRSAGRPVGAALVVVLLALVWIGCHRPLPDGQEADRSPPQRIQGCWSLSPYGEGVAADTVRRWLEEGVLPGVVRLDTARIGETADGNLYRARSYVRSREQPDLLSAWRTVAPDSIRVETPGALAGIVLQLEVRPRVLTGTAVSFTDAVIAGETGRRTGPVEARPEACPD